MTEIKVGDYVRYTKYKYCNCDEPESHFGWVSELNGSTLIVRTLLAGKLTYMREDIEHVPEG